jgi:putative endonuclease
VFYVYILQSLKTEQLYIGHTDNVARRLEEHNTGRGGKYSRQNGPWKLVYSEQHSGRSSAIKRERYLKSTRGSQEKKQLAGILERNAQRISEKEN